MGRPRTVNPNLPPGMQARRRGKKTYYTIISGRKEKSLGTDYAIAVKKWAEYEIDGKDWIPAVVTFNYVAEKYREKKIPKKAARTQKDNGKELAWLLKFFGDPPAPIDQIEPQHVRQYLTWRESAPVRANREKALFSHIFNFARDSGYTSKTNPCQGIKGYTETGRDVYVEPEVYLAIYAEASQPLRDAMDLAYITGQRPSDVLRYREQDARDGALPLRQNKTATKLRFVIEGDLAIVIDRIKARKAKLKVASLSLVVTERGQPLKIWNLRRMFDEARLAAAKIATDAELASDIVSVQFRDFRAKAGTDRAASEGILAASKLLGHSSVKMTEQYVRNRKGELVKPLLGITEKPENYGKTSEISTAQTYDSNGGQGRN